MIRLILWLLDKISYRTRWGLSLADELKIWYYQNYGYKKEKCLCGGKVIIQGCPPDGWEVYCIECGFLADED